jgi:hypothetical protein
MAAGTRQQNRLVITIRPDPFDDGLLRVREAFHLATALALNVDEMHTFDRSDLLGLNEQVMRAEGVPLKICTPYVPVAPEPLPIPMIADSPRQGSLPLGSPAGQDTSDVIEWVTEADFAG